MHVPEEEFECLQALLNPGSDPIPFSGRKEIREQIALPGTLRFAPHLLGIHTHLAEGGLHALLQEAQFGGRKRIQPPEQGSVTRARIPLGIVHFMPAWREPGSFTGCRWRKVHVRIER
jgi:hypothetical protein